MFYFSLAAATATLVRRCEKVNFTTTTTATTTIVTAVTTTLDCGDEKKLKRIKVGPLTHSFYATSRFDILQAATTPLSLSSSLSLSLCLSLSSSLSLYHTHTLSIYLSTYLFFSILLRCSFFLHVQKVSFLCVLFFDFLPQSNLI